MSPTAASGAPTADPRQRHGCAVAPPAAWLAVAAALLASLAPLETQGAPAPPRSSPVSATSPLSDRDASQPSPALSEVSAQGAVRLLAVVIGENRSHAPLQPPLHYADDDAAAFWELLTQLGAETILLSELDQDTRTLHPAAAAAARAPSEEQLRSAMAETADAARAARLAGHEVELLLVYAGHGERINGQAALTLSDGYLLADTLVREHLGAIPAQSIHLIVDACHSYLLADVGARGPGGKQIRLRGFSLGQAPARDDRIGVLLSTSPSSAPESHEWQRVQSGVFSHLVRSGLRGAGDSDRDGVVTYRELVAFVRRAGATIVGNERFRPAVYGRPPAGRQALLELPPESRWLTVGADLSGHAYLEQSNGVRLAEFHKRQGNRLRLVLPTGPDRMFLHAPDLNREYTVPGGGDSVAVAALAQGPIRQQPRGAAQEAFEQLFAAPFDQAIVLAEPWPMALPEIPPLLGDGPRALVTYDIRGGYLHESGLLHGAQLGLDVPAGPLWAGLHAGWAVAAYERSDGLNVQAHEAGLGLTVGWAFLERPWINLVGGAGLHAALVFQRATDVEGHSETTRAPLGRWQATLQAEIPLHTRLGIAATLHAGHVLYDRAGGLWVGLQVGAGLGLQWAL